MVIDQNILNKLVKRIGENKEITTKELKELGVSSKNITGLVRNLVLERVRRGSYVLHNNELDEIEKVLWTQDLDNISSFVTDYLVSIGKGDYNFLVLNMIKLSLLRGDTGYSKVLELLKSISIGNVFLEFDCYIEEFYLAIFNKKYEEAKIYLDIISKFRKLGFECIFIDELKIMLENGLREQETLNIIKVKENKTLDEARRLVKSNLNKVIDKGIILLKSMSDEKNQAICEVINEFPEFRAFEVKDSSGKRVVLRYKPKIEERVDLKDLSSKGREAYRAKDYYTCIRYYRLLLKIGHPFSYVYGKLGLSYMIIGDKETAIGYLTVADYLGKLEGKNLDYADLIIRLKENTSSVDRKPTVRMTVNEFEDNTIRHRLDGVDRLFQFIGDGISFDDACSELGVDGEDKWVAALLVAEECYIQEFYKRGDQYLKLVSNLKNKSNYLNELVNNVRINKKFYKNRRNLEEKSLIMGKVKKRTREIV